jgi:hypothetical protein
LATLGSETSALPGLNKDASNNPYVKWCLSSAWNTAWLYSYYNCLSELSRDLFDAKPNQYRTNREIHNAIKYLPQNEFSPPPFEIEGMICRFDKFDKGFHNCSYDEFVRRLYLSSVKSTSYRKMTRPWWMPQIGGSGHAIWRKQAVEKPAKRKEAPEDEIPSGPGINPADPYGIMGEIS